jgi:type I restriction enzyme S subunit
VVTKGLNPNVEMKDSGIEWIGEIPSHWKTLRSKYIFSEKPSNGIFKKKDQFGFGTKIINVSDVYTNNFLISDENLDSVDCTKEEESSFGVKNGDQFFIRSSLKLEGIGVSSMYIGEEPCVFECHVVKISPNQDIIVPRFLNYYLNSSVCREYFIKHSNTVTMTTIPQEPIKNIQVPIPSKKEQEEIIEYLNKKTMLIDLNISKEKKRIELLKEYKQSLISELVTGKKRVV